MGFIKLFGFYSFDQRDIAFYRPFSREIPFNLYYSFFGLNAIGFRIFAFLIHFTNIFLVYILIKRLTKIKYLPFFVAFFFGITAANVATLYYLAGGLQTLLATTFTLSSLLLFDQYLKTNKLKLIGFTFVTFLLAISSHEQAFILPFLYIGLIFISKGIKQVKRYFLTLLPFFVSISILFIVELFVIGFSAGEKQYQPVFNVKTIFNSLFWYTSWALGIPETLIDFVLPGLKLNPTLLRYWNNYYLFIFPSFFAAVALIFFSISYLLLRNSKIFKSKIFILSVIWFPLGLLPIILLPLHKSTHYLTISLPAFWTAVGLIIFNFYQAVNNKYISKIFILLVISSLVLLSTTSAILGSTNYWAAQRGKFAQQLISQVLKTYPTLPKGATLYFQNDPNYPFLNNEWGKSARQASMILNGSDALQLLYKDPTLKTYYEDTKIRDFLKEDVYPLVAKIY